MSINRSGNGPVVFNTDANASTIVYSFGSETLQVGDMLLIFAGAKFANYSRGCDTPPAGYTFLGEFTGTYYPSYEYNRDTGNTTIFAWYKIADAADVAAGSTTIAFNDPVYPPSVYWAFSFFLRFNDVGGSWATPAIAFGDDVAITEARSTQVGSFVDHTNEGDKFIMAISVPTDAGSPDDAFGITMDLGLDSTGQSSRIAMMSWDNLSFGSSLGHDIGGMFRWGTCGITGGEDYYDPYLVYSVINRSADLFVGPIALVRVGVATETTLDETFDASGGAVTGGTSTFEYLSLQYESVDAAGGAVVGGTSTFEELSVQSESYAAAGGSVAAGTSTFEYLSVQDESFQADGGAVVGGVAPYETDLGTELKDKYFVSVGGSIAGGQALSLQATSRSTAGGSVTGGEAGIAAMRVQLSAGGAVSAGISLVDTIAIQVVLEISSGGAVSAGVAGQLKAAVFPTVGGGIVAGESLIDAAHLQSSFHLTYGGAICEGSAQQVTHVFSQAESGSVCGGDAEIAVNVSVAGQGGSVVSGDHYLNRKIFQTGASGGVAGAESSFIFKTSRHPDGGGIGGGITPVEALRFFLSEGSGAVVGGTSISWKGKYSQFENPLFAELSMVEYQLEIGSDTMDIEFDQGFLDATRSGELEVEVFIKRMQGD